jgi:hypothetical protein
MTSSRLLGFIVSTTGIMVDPLKVEVIVQFPPPCTIPQRKILQGKENFLQHFIVNYAKITKGFMHLLKMGVPFCWYKAAQCSFEALKCAFTSTPMLRPLNYNRYLLLYLVVSKSTMGMVLVQEDDLLEEHVIYYLSQGLVGLELIYSHVEKISLAAVHVVQQFCHYILLHKTTVIAL